MNTEAKEQAECQHQGQGREGLGSIIHPAEAGRFWTPKPMFCARLGDTSGVLSVWIRAPGMIAVAWRRKLGMWI